MEEIRGRLIIPDSVGIKAILEGMAEVATAVGSTYGPNGFNVIIEDEDGSPHITKDGVTVANSIYFKDPLKNLGASLIKDAAIKTLKEVGDGTTTTVILTNIASKEGVAATMGLNPFRIRDYLDKYLQEIISLLRDLSTPINPEDKSTIKRVALNSSNGDEEIAEKITDLFLQIGKDGVVFVKDSDILGIHTQIIKGISVDKGYVSPLFCPSGQSTVKLENCKILIARKVIRDYLEIIPFLQRAREEDKPILLVAPEIDNTVIELFLTNIYEGVFKGCIIQAPYSHERQDEFLRDLGVASGAIVEERDMNTPYLLGESDEVIVSRLNTEFRGLHHDEGMYTSHKAFLEDLMENQTDKFLAEKVAERLAMFSGSIGYVNVGASSEAEKLELKDKLDDVIHAVKAALVEGTVPAGGVALAIAGNSLEGQYESKSPNPRVFSSTEEKAAFILITELCKVPKAWLGSYHTDSKDPTKVVYTALRNALSVAGLLITSRYTVTNDI